jgi:hypothetical protein
MFPLAGALERRGDVVATEIAADRWANSRFRFRDGRVERQRRLSSPSEMLTGDFSSSDPAELGRARLGPARALRGPRGRAMTVPMTRPPNHALALMRVFACLFCLAVPGPASPAGFARAFPAAVATSQSGPPAAEKEERSCKSGASTKRFGWKVVRFGVDTLKYLIGLLIIPVGLFLVCIGAVLEVVEWVAC